MADEKDTTEKTPERKTFVKKKAPAKKAAPKATSYVVADGKALTSHGRIFGPGDAITADQVADFEALIKGGFVVKA